MLQSSNDWTSKSEHTRVFSRRPYWCSQTIECLVKTHSRPEDWVGAAITVLLYSGCKFNMATFHVLLRSRSTRNFDKILHRSCLLSNNIRWNTRCITQGMTYSFKLEQKMSLKVGFYTAYLSWVAAGFKPVSESDICQWRIRGEGRGGFLGEAGSDRLSGPTDPPPRFATANQNPRMWPIEPVEVSKHVRLE